MPQFKKGEIVLVDYSNKYYKAKILDVGDVGEQSFYIHYSGWNKRWDEWVFNEKLFKYDSKKENQNIVATKNKKQKKVKKRKLKPKKSKEPPEKKRKKRDHKMDKYVFTDKSLSDDVIAEMDVFVLKKNLKHRKLKVCGIKIILKNRLKQYLMEHTNKKYTIEQEPQKRKKIIKCTGVNGPCPNKSRVVILPDDDEEDKLDGWGWGDPQNYSYGCGPLCETCDKGFEDKCMDPDGGEHDNCRVYSADTSYCKQCQFRHCAGCGCGWM
eukprot:14589_1